MQRYFDEAISDALLFKHERKQYKDLVDKTQGNSKIRASTVYGMEHLVRFLMKFSQLFDSEKVTLEMNTHMQIYYANLCLFCEAKIAAAAAATAVAQPPPPSQ